SSSRSGASGSAISNRSITLPSLASYCNAEKLLWRRAVVPCIRNQRRHTLRQMPLSQASKRSGVLRCSRCCHASISVSCKTSSTPSGATPCARARRSKRGWAAISSSSRLLARGQLSLSLIVGSLSAISGSCVSTIMSGIGHVRLPPLISRVSVPKPYTKIWLFLSGNATRFTASRLNDRVTSQHKIASTKSACCRGSQLIALRPLQQLAPGQGEAVFAGGKDDIQQVRTLSGLRLRSLSAPDMVPPSQAGSGRDQLPFAYEGDHHFRDAGRCKHRGAMVSGDKNIIGTRQTGRRGQRILAAPEKQGGDCRQLKRNTPLAGQLTERTDQDING